MGFVYKWQKPIVSPRALFGIDIHALQFFSENAAQIYNLFYPSFL